MKAFIDAEVAMTAAISATQNYVAWTGDHDPDDGDHVVPGELRRFLARLRLLHGVPFSYLVPDARLLPIESIRFFYLDRAWTDALVQGALSVGTVGSADRTQLEKVYPHIRAEVDETEREIRPTLELLKAGSGTLTGMLLRSRAVSGWPNLHVRGYARDVLDDDALTTEAESNPERMKVLRMERLAPAVLLVLFDGVPAVVHIEEPRQGIQFGVRPDPNVAAARRLPLRDCTTGDYVDDPQAPLTNANSVRVPFRAGAPGVIDMLTLRTRLENAAATNSGGSLEPNEYALEMLRFPYRQVFGDPDDRDGLRFYAVDEFKAAVALPAWKTQITDLVRGQP